MIEKSLVSGSTMMLVLRLLSEKEMYGYQMIEELAQRSGDAFTLKTGTLYPLLHTMEKQNLVTSTVRTVGQKERKYYKISRDGEKKLEEKQNEWKFFHETVNKVLGGNSYAVYGF